MAILKALYYISIGISFCFSVFLLGLGVLMLLEGESAGRISIAAAGALALVTFMSAYPIFALGVVEEGLSKLNRKVDDLQRNVQESNQYADTSKSRYWFTPAEESVRYSKQELFEIPTYEEAIKFINQKYGISILSEDNLALIKEKVEKINDGGFSAIIFKQKVNETTSEQEVRKIFIEHKVARG